ncbi:MAG: chromosomal replication initiator protein DnaA [Lachnospiraceae bacterium]|nr:chromosomal replication initiator protein DnaA [Lachnospiraceae bacterium]
MEDIYTAWESIKNKTKIEYDMTDAAYRTFIVPLVIDSVINDDLNIMIPFEQDEGIGIDYYSKKYKTPLEVATEEVTGRHYKISFINHKSNLQENNKPVSSYYNVSNLNDKYTFDTFVVGKNNQFVQSAALAVAENPGKDFNPLFLYGNSGVGKTHLMHAIGHYILKMDPTKKVIYETSETFTNYVIKNIREQSTYKLREKYRDVDCLLLDDVQFLVNKEKTQDEFFNTFNDLHSENKAIVLSSDKHPKDIEELSDRLKTRFQSGLTASIDSPDYETRAAILQRYSEINNIPLSNEIIDYIASNIKNNIRELEGAFNKIKALKNLNNVDLDLDVVKNSISEYITVNESKRISMNDIIEVVCDYYNVSIDDINSKKRSQDIVHPRQVATWLCRNMTESSQDQVGKAVGNRDHATVINSINKINKEISADSPTKREIEEIKNILEKR